MIIQYLFILSLFVWFIPLTSAADRFVSPSGTGSACSNSQPCSLDTGIGQLQSGDTLFLKGGNYNQTIGADDGQECQDFFTCNQVPSGSSWSNPIRIKAAPGEFPTIRAILLRNGGYVEVDGEHRLVIDSVREHGTNLFLSNGPFRFLNFEMKNAKDFGALGCGGGGCEYRGLVIHDIAITVTDGESRPCEQFGGTDDLCHGIYLAGPNNIVDGNTFYNIPWGYAAQHSESATGGAIIRNNIVHNARLGFLNYGGGYQNYNNLFYDIQFDCFVHFGSGGNIYHNNTCANSGSFHANPTSADSARNNILFNLGSQGTGGGSFSNNLCSGTTGAACNLSGNPQFVDPNNGDFRLSSASPAIDAGLNLAGIVDMDILGTARPQPPGGAFDIGAYEFTTASPNEYSITRNLATVQAGQNITASWLTDPGPAQVRDWICFTLANQTCENYIQLDGAGNTGWIYIGGTTSPTTAPLTGNFTIAAPLAENSYKFWYCINDSLTNCPAQTDIFQVAIPPSASGFVAVSAAWEYADVPVDNKFINGPNGTANVRSGGKLRYVVSIARIPQ